MKNNKIILIVLILSMIALLLSGCGGGNPVIPPPDDAEDSEIPESTEVISQKIDLSIGGTVEVTDPESIINGVKLIIPSISSEKRGGKSIATITISYINDPYSLELPDNRGFLLPPVVINSDVILEVECILEIPYTEADLSNMGLSGNENIKVYRYNYNSLSWEEIPINKRNFKDISDILEIIFMPEDIDSPYACTFLNADPPSDLGRPQPGYLLYKLSFYGISEGWIPGHVGIYVGEHEKDSEGNPYNVIEALLFGGVQRNYYNPISDFSGSAAYMGARQPKSGTLNPGQRKVIVAWAETIAELGLPYATGQSFPGIFIGMLKGDMVKGELGSYNCVGLAEKAYEITGVNGGQGLVSDLAEGNYCPISTYSSSCVLTPAEQYNKTEPAEGYTVSGRVTDSQGNGIQGVTLNFELVSFNDYHNSFEVTTNSGGDWSSSKLGREGKVTPQKNGYTFEPSTLHEGWVKSDPSTWIVKGNANDIDFTGMSDEPQNHAPVISSLTANPSSININETATITCTASDEDVEDTLTYTWNKNGGTFEGNTSGSSVTWRAPSTEGNYTVGCEVSDGEATDSEQVIISVGDVNHPPVITSSAVTSATKDELYSYDVNATDADGDTLVYSLTTKPSGMTINSLTGLITWTPTATGSFGVTVKVSDGELFDTQSFTVAVEENCTSLGQVQLISPSNGATLPPGDITFSWNPVSNATKYQFVLYKPSGDVELDTPYLSTPTTLGFGAEAEGTYTWKVRAGDDYGYWGTWSDTWSLTIKSTTSYSLRDIGPAGGYIFYDKGTYSDGWWYLEAAPVSTEWTNKEWGSWDWTNCISLCGTLIGGTEMGVGTGQNNTNIIVAWLNSHSETGKAAQLCDTLVYGGYSDWFLPSRLELDLMYTNLKVFGVGDFESVEYSFYWSSFELDKDHALGLDFSDGVGVQASKCCKGLVRAVRAF